MSKYKTHAIGAIIRLGDIKVKVVEGQICQKCVFTDYSCSERLGIRKRMVGECLHDIRTDGEAIHFVLQELMPDKLECPDCLKVFGWQGNVQGVTASHIVCPRCYLGGPCRGTKEDAARAFMRLRMEAENE